MPSVKAYFIDKVRLSIDGKVLEIDPNSPSTPLKVLKDVLELAVRKRVRALPILVHRGFGKNVLYVRKAFESFRKNFSNYGIEFEEEVVLSRKEAVENLGEYVPGTNESRGRVALVIEENSFVRDKELKAVVRYRLFKLGYTNKFMVSSTASATKARFKVQSVLAGIVARTVWPVARLHGDIVEELRRCRIKIVCYDPTRLVYGRRSVSAGTPVVVLEPDLSSMEALFTEEPLVHDSEADAAYSLLAKLLFDAGKYDGAILVKHGKLFSDELEKIRKFEESFQVRFSAVLSMSKSNEVARIYKVKGEEVENPPWGIVVEVARAHSVRLYRAAATWRPGELANGTVVPLTIRVYRNDTGVEDVDLIKYMLQTSAADIEAVYRPSSAPLPLWAAHRASKVLHDLYTYSRYQLKMPDRYRLAEVYRSMKNVNRVYGCYQLVVHGEGS